jgi:hypothetical protein
MERKKGSFVLVAAFTTSEGALSSTVVSAISPKGETISVRLGPLQSEALRDFCSTFGITLAQGARIILSEYLDRAGYSVEMVQYEREDEE